MLERLTNVEKKAIEERAEKLLQENEINATNGVEIVSLANKMGFIVGNASLDDKEDGFIAVDKKQTLFGTSSNKVIGVNSTRDYFFKRFVIAHELGHYVLDDGCNKAIYAHREHKPDPRREEEQDKDFFAACLLMPRKAFLAKYHETQEKESLLSKQIIELQKTFKVPLISIMKRLEELNLVTSQLSEVESQNG